MGTIKKQAKNIIVKVKNKHIVKVGGTLTKTADKISIEATNGNLTFASNKKINIISEKGIKFGDYTPPEERLTEDPKIVEVQFIDENNTILSQSSINGIEGGNATDFLYGKKLKIKIITKEIEDGKKIDFKLKGNTKSSSQDFFCISKLEWELEVKNNECETEFFTLPLLWYSEDFEKYDYTSHQTTINADDLNAFMVEITNGAKTTYLPKKENWLKPIAYRRNYEELIGLFKIDNSGDKDLSSNYENKFISSNSEILNLVREFSEYLQTEDLKIKDINKRVETDAKQLWELAVKQVQNGNLDDRPLYWARNKMQVRLKRHPLFEDEVDFKTSIVCKNTELESIIKTFEELSRNYTDVDFSKAPPDTKKVLITGFDPFVLNQIKYSWAQIDTQNPSGISALYFHGKVIGNAFIQTAIVPVRYEDFDNGIIENIVDLNINKFDIMITTSRNDSNFDIERFASKHRGAFFDNMNIGNSMIYLGNNEWDKNRLNQLPTGNEFYETTLPIKKILSNDLDLSKKIIYYDQTVIDDNGFKINHPTKGGPNENKDSFPKNKITGKSTNDSGSGGDYLSNEVMYRATRKRENLGLNSSKQIGHIHIADNVSFQKANEIIKKIIYNATN
ncbi:hypothetical protein G1K97_10390 [Tenacibaculum finnmarkense]|uniref:hypothetical protein n=1 Tax=Tenacibaculum finnmarkense TaxID=2781243 RepID=UPI001EFAFB7F|nr:hypothetical protein [Tenacibaculum finnmarkense]MCG8893142.1 hypothetical protein [Tenacibaculum finnmarkense]MCG8902248.1 hypothetical protein [Tenacibaculum finnmarkense]